MKTIVPNEKKILSCIVNAHSLQEALCLLYSNGKNYSLNPNEINYFRTVLCYFKSKTNCKILETHQNYVRQLPSNKRCEISDLLIISYSHRLHQAKINFLQAKLASFKDANLGLVSSPHGIDYFKFKLDSTQYRLLKDLPYINPGKTGLPSNILFDACTESITSYGVFYKEKDDKINMAYEITSLLQPVDPSNVNIGSGSKLCYFNTTSDSHGRKRRNKCYCPTSIGQYDVLSTLSANKFESALLNFQIGSPVCFKMAADIGNMLNTVCISPSESIEDFLDFIKNTPSPWIQEDEEWRRRWREMDKGKWRREYIRNYLTNTRWGELNIHVPQYVLLLNVDKYMNSDKYVRSEISPQ